MSDTRNFRLFQSLGAKIEGWLLPGLIFVAALLRVAKLEQNSFWYDELYQIVGVQGSFLEALKTISHTPGATLLDYIATNLSLNYIGKSETALRLAPVLWGVLAVPAIYFLAKYLFNKPVAYLSAFLLTILPLHVEYSREVRYYVLPTLLILLYVYAFVRAVDKKSRWAWLLYTITLVLALYSHIYVVFVVMSLTVWLLLVKRSDRTLMLSFFVYTALAALIYLPWYLSIQSYFFEKRALYNYPGLSEVLVAPFFDVSLGGAVLPPQATTDMVIQKLYSYWGVIRWTAGVFWTLLLVAVYFAFRRTGAQGRPFSANMKLMLVIFFGGIGLSFTAVYVQNYFFAARQFLFFVPMALIAISAAFLNIIRAVGTRLARGANRFRLPWMFAGSCIAMAFLCLWIWWEPLTDNYKVSKQDWRGTAHYLVVNTRPDDILLSPFSDYLSFYEPDLLTRSSNQYPLTVQAMDALAKTHHKIWIMFLHSNLFDRPNVLVQWIADHHLTPLMFGRDFEVYYYSNEAIF